MLEEHTPDRLSANSDIPAVPGQADGNLAAGRLRSFVVSQGGVWVEWPISEGKSLGAWLSDLYDWRMITPRGISIRLGTAPRGLYIGPSGGKSISRPGAMAGGSKCPHSCGRRRRSPLRLATSEKRRRVAARSRPCDVQNGQKILPEVERPKRGPFRVPFYHPHSVPSIVLIYFQSELCYSSLSGGNLEILCTKVGVLRRDDSSSSKCKRRGNRTS